MKKRFSILMAGAVLVLAAAVSIAIFVTKKPKDSPLNADQLLDLGEKYLHELNYEQAIIQFTALIEIEPNNLRIYLGGADAYLHLDQRQEAAALLTAGIEATENENLAHALEGVEKSIVEGYIAIAEAYEAEGWHEKAIEILTRVYEETGDEIIGKKLGIVDASRITFREDYVIEWKDREFERLIREYLGKPTGDIHYDDVKTIEKIEIWGDKILKADEDVWIASYWEDGFEMENGVIGSKNGEIKTLSDLEHFSSLNSLTITHQKNLDISAFADTDKIDCLKRLTWLELTGNGITNISVVSNLLALTSLGLNYNRISDISPISMLIELTSISLGSNESILSEKPLRGLRKLSRIDIDSADLEIFVPLTELRELSIFGSDDWSALTKLQTLEELEITATDENLAYITQLKSLTRLRLHGNGQPGHGGADDAYEGGLTSLAGIGALSNLTRLELLAKNCYDLSPLTALNIEVLELDVPDDCDLTPLAGIKSLKKIIIDDYNYYDTDSGQGNTLKERIREVLPDVEITSDWFW